MRCHDMPFRLFHPAGRLIASNRVRALGDTHLGCARCATVVCSHIPFPSIPTHLRESVESRTRTDREIFENASRPWQAERKKRHAARSSRRWRKKGWMKRLYGQHSIWYNFTEMRFVERSARRRLLKPCSPRANGH